jgi:preprotein translocase subunit SecE
MSMNRETKRMLQRQGQVGPDGEAVRQRRATPAARPPKEKRTPLPQFLREVRGELRKVAWPTRPEVINYSIIVLVTVVILTTLIALLDLGLGSAVLRLYE